MTEEEIHCNILLVFLHESGHFMLANKYGI